MPAAVEGQTDLFMISLAGDGKQWLFSREARLAIAKFDARYGLAARALLLSNQPKPDLKTPIAARLTVEAAIKAIAARMNREEDILLLFLTSHGSRDGTIALSNGTDDLPPLSARDVDVWLRDAGVVRSVIIVSACYSGSWAGPLADSNRILLMAARPDRNSFGCSDDRDVTFFGEALLQQSMKPGVALLPAFEQAKKIIAHWETQGRFDRSEPQRALGPKLLPLWQKLEAGISSATVAQTGLPPSPACKTARCTNRQEK